jgi:hypothetical protein
MSPDYQLASPKISPAATFLMGVPKYPAFLVKTVLLEQTKSTMVVRQDTSASSPHH